MSSPRFSIVCPVYNRATVVKHAIHSILDQSVDDWELILVDDGSTDNTVQELRRFSNIEPRIKVFCLPHTGKIGAVRNYGNQQAQGELIVVQDSDDTSTPDRLAVIWAEYQKSQADVLYHSSYYTIPYPTHQVTLRQFKQAQPFDLKRLLYTQYIPAQIALKRTVALAIPYDEAINVADDWLFLLELALTHKTFHLIDQGLYEYYHSEDSANIIGERDGRRTQDMKHIMRTLRDKYQIDVQTSITDKNGRLFSIE